MQVTFICRTCEYKNQMETGVDGYQQRQVEFESLTDAALHILDTNASRFDSAHEMVAVVREANE